MERPWAFWRRVEYGAVFLVLLSLIGAGLYYQFGYVAPTCFDRTMNGDERGVDCGGACARICSADMVPLRTEWVQAFKVSPGQYNVVAYVENANRDIGALELPYKIRLLDSTGDVIVERTGTTVMPADGVYPIFEGRVMTGDRVPTEAAIAFGSDVYWQQGGPGRDSFALERRELAGTDDKPRLIADVRNTSSEEAEGVEIIATIFDSERRPLTAARTFIDRFPGRATERITFTWPEPVAKNLKSCEIPTDVMLAIDLSGSMNNDGGEPPEPITSVLTAAETFARSLTGEEDQIGLVTYATAASTTENLTRENERVGEVIDGLTIDPREETGATNTGDALKRMAEEFTSPRHSENARKVAILLTDGLATAPDEEPEQYAESEARALKDAGTLLFTIGLGANLNETFLRNIASDPAMYYRAPSTRELSDIYAAIKKSICEDGPTVIEVIAKPRSSFR